MSRLPRGSRSRGRTAPSCLPPRPASPRSRPRRYRTVVPSLLDPPHQFLESRRRQSHVTLHCRFRLLLKGGLRDLIALPRRNDGTAVMATPLPRHSLIAAFMVSTAALS